jgi:hypothetical protein
MNQLLTSGPVWYLMRASGVVSLLLLTAVSALGVATASRLRPGRAARFVTLGLHRNVSLLAVVFLAVHVLTAIADPDASVRAVAAVVPLPSQRYALWLGLGERCAGFDTEAEALLVGGYFGTWVPFAAALDAPLSDAGLRPFGAALGARSIALLPHSSCGVNETARLVAYLAGESAGQCGPCVFGLRATADALASIAACDAGCARALERLRRLAPQVAGRGACAHPDGATRLVASALAVFADEIRHHLAGHCTARSSAPVLPIPPAGTEWR